MTAYLRVLAFFAKPLASSFNFFTQVKGFLLVNHLQSLVATIKSRKMGALLFLGFASGLPLFLTSRTLQAWMTKADVDLSKIGLFSLVALPYSLKFLWAPFLERYMPPFLGRRRGWLLICQAATLFAIAAMAWQDPKQGLQLLAINALLLAFFSASQDIVVDAYRTDSLTGPEVGAGAGIYVAGYRGALIVSGAFALFLADRIPWPTVYLVLAGLMLIGIFTTFWAPEPPQIAPPPTRLWDAIVEPVQELISRLGGLKTLLILVFIVLYRYADSLAGAMVTPFLLKTGFTQTDIGLVLGVMGLLASIVGALVGGAIVSRIGVNRSLWVFGIIQAASNLAYFLLAKAGKNYLMMVLAINIENLCGGLAIAGFFAFLMSLCSQKFSGPQYALLSSLMAFSSGLLVAPAGQLAKDVGWANFFLISLAAALPSMLLLPFFAPWHQQPTMPRPGSDL
jgi:PAT family beta-lactamase induction signal transducer AmpG